jgi:PAS domain S-box-containing protein
VVVQYLHARHRSFIARSVAPPGEHDLVVSDGSGRSTCRTSQGWREGRRAVTSPEPGRDEDDPEVQIEGMFQRLLDLQDEVGRASDEQSASLLSDVLHELSASVEDLTVRFKEIRAQNEALKAAQARIDSEIQCYRELFDGAPDGYLVTDEYGIIVESNRASAELLGLESRLLRAKPLIVFVDPAHRERILVALHDVLAETSAQCEVRFAPVEGRAFRAFVHATTASPIARTRRVVRWLIRDECQRIAAEEAFALEEERDRLASPNISDAVVTTDLDDRILYISPAMETVLHRKWEELQRSLVTLLFHPDDWDTLAALEDKARAGRAPVADVLRSVNAAGGSVSMEVVVAAKYDQYGEPTGLCYTLRDPDESKETRLALAVALTRERHAASVLRASDAAKDALLLAASHDLGSPVAAVAGLADQLLAHPSLPGGEIRRMAEGLASAGSQLVSILANLLDAERVLGGHVVARSETVDLHRLVVSSVRAHGLPTSSVWPRRGPVLVAVDAGLTARIIDNVVGNALRHTPSGTPIRVSFDCQDAEVVLGVADRGPGVPDEQKDEIFEPFHRHNRNATGLGLGLFIVRRFAELQGGRTWVEDTDGGGATFRVALPAAVPGG